MKKRIEILTETKGIERITFSIYSDNNLTIRIDDSSNSAEITLSPVAVNMVYDALQEYYGKIVLQSKILDKMPGGLCRRFDWMHYPSKDDRGD